MWSARSASRFPLAEREDYRCQSVSRFLMRGLTERIRAENAVLFEENVICRSELCHKACECLVGFCRAWSWLRLSAPVFEKILGGEMKGGRTRVLFEENVQIAAG